MSALTFTSSLKTSVTANQPLFAPASGLPDKASIGKGKYVALHPVSKVHYTLPPGFLPSKLDEYDSNADENAPLRLVIPGKEEDITKRVGSTTSTFTLPLMLAHPDEGVCSAFVMKDAIVAYRANIGKPSKKASVIPGKETIYMKSYAYIGLPADRVNWLISSLHDLHGLEIANTETYIGKFDGEYYWINTNISESVEPQVFIRDNSGETTITSMMAFMRATKKSFLGHACLTISLKRVEIEGKFMRALSFSFKSMQLVSFSDATGPALASSVEFVEDKSAVATDEVNKALSMLKKLSMAESSKSSGKESIAETVA
ncbi:UNVERIFIED_CONTAM: hypothetical protein HDU68_009956 [Siphonaria sp. JEL0065]|nr:hypothetical protein HDU68_009956 [Siphonaria sp. JEL0065]